MKPVFTILLAALALAPVPATAAESVARFSNDDLLTGTLESLSSDFIIWKSPVLDKPVPFFVKDVLDLSLPGTLPEIAADHEAILTLTNGDTVRGQLASVTDETVALDTWFAGRMHFNRLMVSSVRIEGKSTFLYAGPTGMDGWTQSGDTPIWSYGRSAFRSSGTGGIARGGLLPDECAVSFEASWKSDSIALKVILFSDEPSSIDPGSGYELSFQRGSVYLRNGKTQSFLGSTHSQELMENDTVHVEIRASRTAGKVCLFINGRIIEIWSDAEVGKSKFGSCLHFVSLNTLPMRISRIGVASWDGRIEELPEPRIGMIRQFGIHDQDEDPALPAPEPTQEDRMKLANGDSLKGEVTAIQDGRITVKTPLGDINLPVARLRNVTLKKVELERCILRNGDIRAWFPDGTSIVFRLDAVAGDTLTGSSQNFGSADFNMRAFSRIEFNIHDPALESKRATNDW